MAYVCHVVSSDDYDYDYRDCDYCDYEYDYDYGRMQVSSRSSRRP